MLELSTVADAALEEILDAPRFLRRKLRGVLLRPQADAERRFLAELRPQAPEAGIRVKLGLRPLHEAAGSPRMAAVHYGPDDEAARVQPDLVRPAQREIGEPHAEPGLGLVALQPPGARLCGSQPVEGSERQQRLELIHLLARPAGAEQQPAKEGVPPVPRSGAAEPGAVAPVRAFEADPLSDRRMVLGVVVVEFLFARRNPAVDTK